MTVLPTFLSTTATGISRAIADDSGSWIVSRVTMLARPHALAADPFSMAAAYAGTSAGILRSDNAGLTWRPAGLDGRDVRAIATSPAEANLIFAGTRPSALFVSRDGGRSWSELPALRRLARRRIGALPGRSSP